MEIRDARTQDSATVTKSGELVTRAVALTELQRSSLLGSAYSWDSLEKDIDTGDTMLFVKNIGDSPLVIDSITINGSNVICTWTILTGSLTTTPAGTLVAGANLNRSFSSIVPDALAYADETALADGTILSRVKTGVSTTLPYPTPGIILGKNQYIQINQITESTSGSVIVFGHFTAPE